MTVSFTNEPWCYAKNSRGVDEYLVVTGYWLVFC